MHRKGLMILVALVALTGTTAWAEEIIHFTNGSSLPVRGHVVEGDMIKVDLGDDGFMAFPASVVDKIERADANVVLPPSLTNRILGSTAVFATPPPDRESWELPQEMQEPTHVTTDSRGVAVVPVFPESENRGRAKMMSANVLGRAGTATSIEEGRPGTERLGTRHVIQPNEAQYSQRRKDLRGISPR